MRLLGHQNLGNPRRVSIFLAEKGIEIPWITVDLANGEQKTTEFLGKNPSGKVPVLDLGDGTYLSETIAICRYLESLYPDPPMFGVGIRDQVNVEMWQRKVEIEIFINTSHYIRHTSPQLARMESIQVPEWGNICKTRVEAGLHMVDRQLADNVYLTGSRFTVADITLVLQLLGMPGKLGVKVPDDCPNLARWLELVYQRPSVRGTQPPGMGLIQDVVAREASMELMGLLQLRNVPGITQERPGSPRLPGVSDRCSCVSERLRRLALTAGYHPHGGDKRTARFPCFLPAPRPSSCFGMPDPIHRTNSWSRGPSVSCSRKHKRSGVSAHCSRRNQPHAKPDGVSRRLLAAQRIKAQEIHGLALVIAHQTPPGGHRLGCRGCRRCAGKSNEERAR